MSAKRFKRLVSAISILLVFISLIVISGCQNNEKSPEESTTPTESVTEEYISNTTTESNTSITESTTESTTKKKIITSTTPVLPNESTTDDTPAHVSSIKILNLPYVTTYCVGDEFSTDGLKVQAYFHNGTTADITEHISFTYGTDKLTSTPGVKKVHIEYVDFDTNLATTYFQITVKESLTEPTETTESIENTETVTNIDDSTTLSSDENITNIQ